MPSSSLLTSLSLKSHPSSLKTLFQPVPAVLLVTATAWHGHKNTSPYPTILQEKRVMLTHISVFPLLFLHLSASTLSSTVVSETISALLSLTTMCMTRPLLMWASKVLFQGGYMVGFFCTYTWPFSVERENTNPFSEGSSWDQIQTPTPKKVIFTLGSISSVEEICNTINTHF